MGVPCLEPRRGIGLSWTPVIPVRPTQAFAFAVALALALALTLALGLVLARLHLHPLP
jgi:hypothetical protein